MIFSSDMRKRFRLCPQWTTIILFAGLHGVFVATATPTNSLRVVTSFYPIYIATLNVTQGAPGVEVVNMTSPFTGCLHDYQIVPRDLVILTKAQVFVMNGGGLEAFLDKALAQAPGLRIIDTSAGMEFIRLNGVPNPHVWLSVTLAMQQVSAIADGLARLDPARADVYRRNAAGYRSRLAELQALMRKELASLPSREILTFHEAFPYFGRDFNLTIVGVVEREPGSEPSARDLAGIIRLIRDRKVKAIFTEPQYPARSAERIAQETGVRIATLDPVVTGPMRADAYVEIMTRNMQSLKQALQP